MYIPKYFEETRTEVLHELIRVRPLATLVTMSANGLNANHIPMHLSASPAPFGTLTGHVARANPLLRDLEKGEEVLAVFQEPGAYISPSWYTTKQENAKVVPTWNYVAVHAYGTMRIVDDPGWLRSRLEALTADHEALFAEPWYISDAPDEFIERVIGNIVGIEMVVSNLLGKWKVSQNQPPQNRAGVVAGLQAGGSEDGLAMAGWIESITKNAV